MDNTNRILILIAVALAIGIGGLLLINSPKVVVEAPPVAQSPEPQPEPEPEPDPMTPDEAVLTITENEIKENLEYLASDELEGRMSGKKGNVLAAKFIKEQFESFGLNAEYQKFKIRRVNPGPNNEAGDDFTQNIIGWIEGNDPNLKNEIIVVGAHMDHIGYGPSMSRTRKIAIHPGADDNASGTVALIAVAKAFSNLKGQNARTVVFQAYSAEEMGLIGARHYCDNPMFPKSNPSIKSHKFMLNMDMVGWLGQGYYYATFHGGDSSIDVSKIINELNDKYAFARKITSRGGGGSDHAAFYNRRVPVAFLHTGMHQHYHLPSDTADKINYGGLTQVARYGFELAWKVCQSPNAPRFNNATFKVMEYTHDHGHPDVPFYIHSYHKEEDEK